MSARTGVCPPRAPHGCTVAGRLFSGFGQSLKITRWLPAAASLLGLVLIVLAFAFTGSLLFAQVAPHSFPGTIAVAVDASDVQARIFHARLTIPVTPGPLTLLYAKWIPGEHAPSGPVQDLTGLKITAGGQPLSWRRDEVNMFAIYLDVPSGVTQIEAALDYTSPAELQQGFTAGTSATARLAVLSWNWVLLYPQGYAADQITCRPTLRVPPGWQFGTALSVASQAGSAIEFQPVSLYTLVDSPVVTGRFFRRVKLSSSPPVEMDIVADSSAALDMPPELEQQYRQLVAETTALFGAVHYRDYHFLLTLSDYVAHFGLEHHESDDSRIFERSLIDSQKHLLIAPLLPHEYVHSWNGKYRRPAGLMSPDYQQPMKTDLLWVYEGLTEYLGDVLAARSGLRTPEDFRDALALHAALMETRSGRIWRPLVDTAISAQILYYAPQPWTNWRRGVDFYEEGELLWLEADTIIRNASHSRKSLDDFCKLFAGPPGLLPGQVPQPKTYTFDDVVNTLNQVLPYDWQKFFSDRLSSTSRRAPLGGLEASGWKLTYSDTPSGFFAANEAASKQTDLTYSLGLLLGSDDGKVVDVRFGSAAAKAGIGPGMILVAVNGRAFTPEIMHDALQEAKDSPEPLELLIRNASYYQTYRVDYHGGGRYPQLVRNQRADLLTDIIKPRVPRGAEFAVSRSAVESPFLARAVR